MAKFRSSWLAVKRFFSPARRAARGVTLIEVVCATLILEIGMLGILLMQLMSMQGIRRAADISLATNLAANMLDELRVSGPISLKQKLGQNYCYDYLGMELDVASDALCPDEAVYKVHLRVYERSSLYNGNFRDVEALTTWTSLVDKTRYRSTGTNYNDHQVSLRTKINVW